MKKKKHHLLDEPKIPVSICHNKPRFPALGKKKVSVQVLIPEQHEVPLKDGETLVVVHVLSHGRAREMTPAIVRKNHTPKDLAERLTKKLNHPNNPWRPFSGFSLELAVGEVLDSSPKILRPEKRLEIEE